VNDEPNNSSGEEELLPDERPRRSKYDESDTAGKAWEKSSLAINKPFQLQPSTAADPPARRRSRGRQGRDPLCSKYRMAWVLVFFDLPVGTTEERRDANNFPQRFDQGWLFHGAIQCLCPPCGTADRVETQVRHLKSKIPSHGEVRGLMISRRAMGPDDHHAQPAKS